METKFTIKGTTTFEITINPNDKYQINGKPRRLQLFWTKIHPLLIQAFDNYKIEYKLYLELSMPHININAKSQTPRLHLHGTITLKNPVIKGEFLLKSLYHLSRWSNVTYNLNRGKEWQEYCTKSKCIIKPLCESYHCPYTISHNHPIIHR